MGVNKNILISKSVNNSKSTFNSYAKAVTGNATKEASNISIPLKNTRHGSGKKDSIC